MFDSNKGSRMLFLEDHSINFLPIIFFKFSQNIKEVICIKLSLREKNTLVIHSIFLSSFIFNYTIQESIRKFQTTIGLFSP